ncbi:chemotaxis protein [Pelagicoccus sp. NFK12]|uniref:Chemotaxis protein n=1 Tax=Pelagicoccus enzymogenes TaxID=2773457 RepID=A0A927IJT7_9BACT|nr:methyl-accepting chemotaxis protein [Pelagicoccus enzymogenes]MBD5781890.1 chemotaxis protein [Pelagicoccus enzymogenes]MDQ8196647.1 methyl-accepting chemotaxis protein [Pelagicoccus enzymogenes]
MDSYKIAESHSLDTVGPAHGLSPDQNDSDMSLDRISDLARDLNSSIGQAIDLITNVNVQTRLLSFNAQIEAARAGGSSGAAFAVVAQAIQELSDRTSKVAKDMNEETQGTIKEVDHISEVMAYRMLGTRLRDLALNNIDLIDRNLYERTCDVRWWATDSSLVDALSHRSREGMDFASRRMGIILSAYTVYYDLVLTDLDGKVVANGRPDRYRSVGADVSESQWFRSARATSNGDEYGFETCHRSSLVNGERVLAYSCVVREGGESTGRPLGVLGILFNWDELAQVIVERTPLPQEEWSRSRVCIVDQSGKVLADTKNSNGNETLDTEITSLFSEERNYSMINTSGKASVVAHAAAPGYETYSTGWHSIIIQERPERNNAKSKTSTRSRSSRSAFTGELSSLVQLA